MEQQPSRQGAQSTSDEVKDISSLQTSCPHITTPQREQMDWVGQPFIHFSSGWGLAWRETVTMRREGLWGLELI